MPYGVRRSCGSPKTTNHQLCPWVSLPSSKPITKTTCSEKVLAVSSRSIKIHNCWETCPISRFFSSVNTSISPLSFSSLLTLSTLFERLKPDEARVMKSAGRESKKTYLGPDVGVSRISSPKWHTKNSMSEAESSAPVVQSKHTIPKGLWACCLGLGLLSPTSTITLTRLPKIWLRIPYEVRGL
jgi:hypothetical protein